MKGTRADVRLVELGLCDTREKARAVIMSGSAWLDGKRVEKPGENVPEDSVIELKGDANPFVSRGGLKLEKAVKFHGIDLEGAVAADIGSSTGGFTDCMLQHGAKRVYSIDVGYGQLDWKLRNDPRVVVMERTNARFTVPEWFEAPLDFASMDVSFISIKLILPGVFTCLREGGRAVILVKPQFEAGKGKVGKNGVVRDADIHTQVLGDCADFAHELGFTVDALDYSPVTGPKGNIEFLMVLTKNTQLADEGELPPSAGAGPIVIEAHEHFKNA